MSACGSSGSSAYVLTVNSVNPASGVTIGAAPADSKGTSSAETGITLFYSPGTSITLTAPATSSGSTFTSWSGCATASTVTCTVTMNADTTVTANYAAPVKYVLSVNSTNPAAGVAIGATPADNLWYREGEVLYSLTPINVVLEPTLIPPEGSPQIFIGNATVWKMWFSDAGAQSIFYAESPDGVAWTRYGTSREFPYGTPVVRNCLRSFVIENSGVYYLYCAPIPGNDSSIDEYTSTDGVHFALAHANVIHAGMGSWNTGLNNNSGGVVVNGTLYLFVEHSFIGIGLFTSTDFHTFTPVTLAIPNVDTQGPTVPYLVDGTWYMWVGTAMTEAPGTAEYGIQRWSAPDLAGPWTNSETGFDFVPETADEGVATPFAETLDPFVLEVAGRTYLYYSANRGTSQSPQQFQIIKLAIADMPLTDLVQRTAGMNADGVITGATGFTLTYNAGTRVTLTALTTSGGKTFVSWTGCTNVSATICTVTINGNTSVTANYN